MEYVEPDSLETLELLQRVSSGDFQAFEQLFARHREMLRAFIEPRLDSRLLPRVDPSDLVQETQMEAFRGLEDYLRRRPMPFLLWLRKTAYQRLIKARRHHQAARRDLRRETPTIDRSSALLPQRLLAKNAGILQTMATHDLVERVQLVLSQLREIDREVLTLRIVDELSHEEIAYLLDLESATVRKRFARGLLRLRSLLAKEGLLEPPE